MRLLITKMNSSAQLEKLEAEQKAIEAEEAKTQPTRKGKDKAKRAAR